MSVAIGSNNHVRKKHVSAVTVPCGQHSLPQSKIFKLVNGVVLKGHVRVLSDASQIRRSIREIEPASMSGQSGHASQETIDISSSFDLHAPRIMLAKKLRLRLKHAKIERFGIVAAE